MAVGKKMFGNRGARSLACAEVDGMSGQIEDLNFLWTGNNVTGVIPRLAKNPNYLGDVKVIQRIQGMVSHGLR
jgi:hypothetical protein